MNRLKAHFVDWAFRRVVSPLVRRFHPIVVLSPSLQRLGLRVARFLRLWPHDVPAHIPRLALIWRHADVCEVLGDHERFSVRGFDEKMTECGNPFMLGYDFNNPEYQRQIALLRGVLKPEDRDRVREIAQRHAQAGVARAASRGEIDVVQDLVAPVVMGFLNDYFGVPDLPGPRAGTLPQLLNVFLDTASYMFNVEILTGYTAGQAKESGQQIKAHLQSLIAKKRRALPVAVVGTPSAPSDTMIDRLMGTGEPDDLVRRIVGGTVSGSIAVTFSQCLWVIDRLIDLPPVELAELRRVADGSADGLVDPNGGIMRPGVVDDALLGRYVREASRFKPFPPGLLRRCEVPQKVGRGERYARTLPAGTVVAALTWSAAFDKDVVPDPAEFHIGRDERQYLLFGTGQHACPGAQPDRPFAQLLMGQMVAALFALPGLQRAPGAPGFIQVDQSGGRWPQHFRLRFDAQSAQSIPSAPTANAA